MIGEAKWPAANLKACRGPDRRIGAFAVARGADGRRNAHAAQQHDGAGVVVALTGADRAAAPEGQGAAVGGYFLTSGQVESASLPNASSPLIVSTSGPSALSRTAPGGQ